MKQALAKLTARERRAIDAVLALLVLVLGLRATPRLVAAVSRLTARAEATSLELARGRELLAGERLMRDSLAARAQRMVRLAPLLLAGATPLEARAEFSAAVAAAAARSGLRLTRQESRPDTVCGPFLRIGLRVETEADVRALAGWLAELESGRQLLTIDELRIQALEPAAAATEPERLRITATIAGLAAPRSGS